MPRRVCRGTNVAALDRCGCPSDGLTLSILIPACNEERNLAALYAPLARSPRAARAYVACASPATSVTRARCLTAARSALAWVRSSVAQGHRFSKPESGAQARSLPVSHEAERRILLFKTWLRPERRASPFERLPTSEAAAHKSDSGKAAGPPAERASESALRLHLGRDLTTSAPAGGLLRPHRQSTARRPRLTARAPCYRLAQ
jgi:hypothetical protein